MTRHSKKHGGKSFLHEVKKDVRAMERRRDLAGLYFLNISDVIYSKCYALQGLRLGCFGLAASKASSELGISYTLGVKVHAQLLSLNTTKA